MGKLWIAKTRLRAIWKDGDLLVHVLADLSRYIIIAARFMIGVQLRGHERNPLATSQEILVQIGIWKGGKFGSSALTYRKCP